MTPNGEPIDADLLIAQACALFEGERDAIANAANLAALIFSAFEAVNWAGFYFIRGEELVLGPFQGKPACVRIARGAGVCGAAWERAATLVVADVHRFAGHIACDSASNSEVVVPLLAHGGVIGVLDVDSPKLDRFAPGDVAVLEALARAYLEASAPISA